MMDLIRAATLLLAPFSIALIFACSPTLEDDPSLVSFHVPGYQEVDSAEATNASSLTERGLINVAFMHPVGLVIQSHYRRPLMDHLTAHTPYVFRSLFSMKAEQTVGMLEIRLAEVCHMGVVSYIEADSEFGAVPLVRSLNPDGEPVSHSVFVTPEGSPLRSLADLRGHSLALGSYHSTLSNLIARHELTRAGVGIEELKILEHLDNDDAVASAVLQGRFDAGAVEDMVARWYQDKGLRAFHVSPPVPSAPFVVRADLPQSVSGAIRDALLLLDFEGAKDRQEWDEDLRYGFAPASPGDYEPVRQIIETSVKGCQGACHVEKDSFDRADASY
jgi:phosphonate transport system substrate-binding protein